MKKILVAGGLALCAVGLVGCGEPTDGPRQTEGRLYVEVVTLPDDSTVDCVWRGRGGISCDWDTRG